MMAGFVKIEIVLQYRNEGIFSAQLLGTVNVNNFNRKMREYYFFANLLPQPQQLVSTVSCPL